MKKILMSLLVIALAVAVVAGGTMAYFSDTETSSGNTFTAGTIDLKIGLFDGADNLYWVDDPDVPNVNTYLDGVWNELVNNLKPGDSATIPVLIMNGGTIAGVADFHLTVTDNDDNYCNEPELAAEEAAYSVGNATCGPTGGGELGANIDVVIKYKDSTGAIRDIYTGTRTLDYLSCKNLVAPVKLAGGDWAEWLITVSIDSGVGNIIQSDSVVCDVEFSLNQS